MVPLIARQNYTLRCTKTIGMMNWIFEHVKDESLEEKVTGDMRGL